MNRAVHTTSRAELDLLEIWLHIAEDSIDRADKLTAKLHARFQQLADFPELGESCPKFQAGVRRSTVDAYVVYYRIADDHVLILRVFHGARSDNPAQ